METLAREVIDAFADPWALAIMRRALLEVGLLGLVGGVLGCWIVFYGLSYSAESLAHALFPGLVLAALTGIPLLLGGALGLVAAAAAIALAGRVSSIGADTAIAIAVTTLLGAGTLMALSADTPPGIQNLLFGDVLAVSRSDLTAAAALAVGVLVALRLAHGRLLVVGFDRAGARALGVRPPAVELALLVLIALAILVSVEALGNLLVVALLVGPAATARLLARRMKRMMALAALLGIAAGIGGLYLSFYAGTAAGASIAACVVALHLAAAAAATVRNSAPARNA